MKSKHITDRKHGQWRKTNFSKELVENADLPKSVPKPVLNKIMTAYEWCVKYNFVAPFTPTNNKLGKRSLLALKNVTNLKYLGNKV